MEDIDIQKELYGGIYDASPGSDRDKEQKRRIRAVMVFLIPPAKKKPKDDKPETFIDKAITKGGGE